jgi:hypothetical protein
MYFPYTAHVRWYPYMRQVDGEKGWTNSQILYDLYGPRRIYLYTPQHNLNFELTPFTKNHKGRIPPKKRFSYHRQNIYFSIFPHIDNKIKFHIKMKNSELRKLIQEEITSALNENMDDQKVYDSLMDIDHEQLV